MPNTEGFSRWMIEQAKLDAGYRCIRCGSPDDCGCHHRVGRAEGGSDENLSNLAYLCGTCHTEADVGLQAGYVLMSDSYVPIEDVPDNMFNDYSNGYT